MGSNVDKIVGDIIEKFRPLVRDAVTKADADARGELLSQFKQVLGSNGSAKTVAATPGKRKVGRPRKIQPETAQASAEKPKKKAKAKRVVTEEVRQKLAENLKRAREVKAEKSKPAKRKVGRPRKATAPAATATTEQA